jgi:hypothetical protein
MAHLSPTSNSSPSGSHNTRLTPETDSDGSDSELGDHELGLGIELRERDPEKDKGRDEECGDDLEEDESGRFIRRGSASTTQSFQLYTPDEERAVVRKLDRRLVLFVHILYMLSFLDRSSRLPLKLCVSAH